MPTDTLRNNLIETLDGAGRVRYALEDREPGIETKYIYRVIDIDFLPEKQRDFIKEMNVDLWEGCFDVGGEIEMIDELVSKEKRQQSAMTEVQFAKCIRDKMIETIKNERQ